LGELRAEGASEAALAAGFARPAAMSDSEDELAELRRMNGYQKARTEGGWADVPRPSKAAQPQDFADEPSAGPDVDVAAIMGFGSFGGAKRAPAPAAAGPGEAQHVPRGSSGREAAAGARRSSGGEAAARSNADGASSGGQRDSAGAGDGEDSEPDVGPPAPPTADAEPGVAGEGADDGVDERLGIPASHELTVQHHARLVSCLAVDPQGARFATGGFDDTVRMYDFNGMTSAKKCYRMMEPGAKKEGSYPILALSWSPAGECLLVVNGSPQPFVYDREGHELGELPRGYMYIRDMRNTTGHVSACTWGQWHPTDRGTAITSSEDGTVRAWDLWEIKQTTVIKPQPVRPGTRVHVSTCAYSNDGAQIAAGLKDGSVHLYDVRGKFGYSAAVGTVLVANADILGKGRQEWNYATRPKHLFRSAHADGESVSSVQFFRDGLGFVSRSTDGTVARWDQRNLKKAVWVREGLLNTHENTAVRLGPGDRVVATGTSAARDGDNGQLVFLNAETGEVERMLGLSGSVVGLEWHDKIDQILVGHGGRKEGVLTVLYNPRMSSKGALLAMAVKARAADPLDWMPQRVYLPQAAIREDLPWKKARKPFDRNFVHPKEKTRPSQGLGDVKGPGRMGSTHHALFVRDMVAKSGELTKNVLEDAREQLLRHDGAKDEVVDRLMSAYSKTQPKRIYDTEDLEDEPKKGAKKPKAA